MIVSQSRQMKYSGTDSYPRAEDKGTTAERERERERFQPQENCKVAKTLSVQMKMMPFWGC